MTGGGPPGKPRESPLKFKGDFDFEGSNATFDKEKVEEELKQKLTISDTPTAAAVAGMYTLLQVCKSIKLMFDYKKLLFISKV